MARDDSKMKRSAFPMLRQHSHPPAASSALSPTTTAATAGIRLNDPALRNVAVSTSSCRAAPKNNVASSASTNPAMAHVARNTSGVENTRSFHGDNGSSPMTNSWGKLPPFTDTALSSGDKENNHNSKLPHYQDSKPAAALTERNDFCETDSHQQQQQPMMDLDEYESEQMMADEAMSSESTSTPRNNESMVGEIQLPYTHDENHEMNTLGEFNMDNDDDNDDDGSDCSGNTVVAMERPPTGLTEVELNKYYWEICYGPGHAVPPPTVVKCFPTKSCLSTKKKTSRPTEIASSMTPRKLLTTKSPSFEMLISQEEACKEEDNKTPTNNITKLASSSTITRGQSAVKFGVNVAAEFDLDMPTTEMKPMPPNVVKVRFPNDKVETEKDAENEEFSRETKRNVSILAEWDDDFDSIVDNDDSDDEEGEVQLPKRRRKQTPYKQRGRGGRGNTRPRKTRRQSSIFGSAERGRSLLDISDETDEDCSSSGLPFSVTIDPDEYTSPSSNSLNDSMSSIEMPDTSTTKKVDRESMSSTCISPSSLRSGSIIGTGTNRSSTSSSKETPKSARTSSSTILQTVHASGAFLPTNSPQGNELLPNQLKYSPKETAQGANTSFSSSDSSLGSDIMSMFTKHSLEDENEGDLLGRQLSIIDTHPTEGFRTSMSDLEQCISVSGKSASHFINDHISKGMNLSVLLSLLNDSDSSDNSSMFSCNSQWMTSTLSKDEVSFMEECFEFILQNAHNANDANNFCKGRAKVAADPDVQTIASCLKILEELSAFSWSSSVELSCAQIVLEKFELSSKDRLKEARRKLASFDDMLRDVTSMILQQHSTPRKLKTTKRKYSSKTEDTIASIERLEIQLAKETERLNACKLAREIFTAHLDVERASPICAISEEVRTTIFPSPLTHNGSDFSFSLLDGIAEVAMNVALDEEALQNIEIGCFLKDDGDVSISLLKAVLLGCTELDPNQGHGPFPLRNSLQSFILPSSSSESMHVGMRDLFADATQMFFRIDNLVRTVSKLEREALCTFNCDHQGNVILSATFASGDDLLRIEFLFRNLLGHSWTLTTVPCDVAVSTNASEENELASKLTLISQQHARDTLKSDRRDPSLLQRICHQVIENFEQGGVKNDKNN